eukprot:6070885-Amphidinium_carterae.1
MYRGNKIWSGEALFGAEGAISALGMLSSVVPPCVMVQAEKQKTTTNTIKTKRKARSSKSIGIHQNTGKMRKMARELWQLETVS